MKPSNSIDPVLADVAADRTTDAFESGGQGCGQKIRCRRNSEGKHTENKRVLDHVLTVCAAEQLVDPQMQLQ
jgi:hypothetical protein